ncbi:glucokinase [Marinactinospora thermotolerans]|uniref:glucokinase n=1 Tax=Marinactinospora thermotolerans TaxID=531310 RepID=UPI003D8E2DAC
MRRGPALHPAPAGPSPGERLRSLGLAASADLHHGPGLYTSLRGHVTALGPLSDGPCCLGIDAGATMTRVQLGTCAPDGPRPLLKIRYLTADRPEGFLEQVVEITTVVRALDLAEPRAIRIGIAGPVYDSGPLPSAQITNRPGWSLTDFAARLRELTGCHDTAVANDMTVGMRWLPGGPWERLLRPLLRPRPAASSPSSTGRLVKCQVGTGLNIAMRAAEGGVEAFEYGHHPFPATGEADRNLVRALAAIHGREIVTFEDVLGGRGFGPLVLAHAASATPESRFLLPADLRDLLDSVPRAPTAVPPVPGITRTVLALDTRIRELSSRFSPDPTRTSLLDAYAGFGLWALGDFLRGGFWPGFRPILSAYGRHLALFVLSAAQITACDDLYVGGRLVMDPTVRQGFLTAYPRLAGQFPHGRRLVDRVAVHAFDEPDYEHFLFLTAAESVPAQERG